MSGNGGRLYRHAIGSSNLILNITFSEKESMPQSSDYRIPFLLIGRNLSFLITSDISCFQVHDTRPPLAIAAQHADYALASR